LENHRLQEINRDLQSSIDSLKSQLKQALGASASVAKMAEQITILKNQLAEANRQKSDVNLKIPADGTPDRPQNANLVKKIRKLKLEIKKLRTENESAQNTIQEQETEIKRTASKYNRRIQASMQATKAAEEKITILTAEKGAIQSENDSLRSDVEDLKRKLAALQSRRKESEATLLKFKQESNARESAWDNTSREMEIQSREISELQKDRSTLITVVQKLYALLCSTELKVEEAAESKRDRPRVLFPQAEFDIARLTFPFSGDLKAKCTQIASMSQYEPIQTVQMILNEASKTICKHTDRVKELEDAAKTEKTAGSNLTQVMTNFLRELQGFLNAEGQLKEKAFYDCDSGLCRFIAEKTAAFESLLGVASSRIDRNFEATIREQLQPNEKAYAIFLSQFTLNSLLAKQLKSASDSLLKQSEVEQICNLLNCNSIDSFAEKFRGFQSKFAETQRNQKKLIQKIRSMSQSLMQNQQSENSHKLKVEKLQLQLDALQNECEVLRVQSEVSANELALAQDRCRDFQNEIASKEHQIHTGQEALRGLETELDIAASEHSKALKKRDDLYRSQIAEYESRIKWLEQENDAIREKAKRLKRVCEKAKSPEKVITRAPTQNFNRASDFEIDAPNAEKLSELEETNRQMQVESTHLRVTIKALEMQVASLQDQIRKERQKADNRVSAQQVAYDSRVQDVARKLKLDFQKQKDELFAIVVRGLSGSQSFDVAGMDDECLSTFIAQVRKDLDRLRIFQRMPFYPGIESAERCR
jgi:nucleoprotein TPR